MSIRNSPPERARSYVELGRHPEPFNPFAPDAIGAVREAYAFITQPEVIGPEKATYSTRHYNQLVRLLGAVMRDADQAALERAA